jgi:NADPH:quinone reductase-like Zn-dependent oxidoreductase
MMILRRGYSRANASRTDLSDVRCLRLEPYCDALLVRVFEDRTDHPRVARALDCIALNDKQVLITGATNGIGLAAAEALAALGANLAIVGRSKTRTRIGAIGPDNPPPYKFSRDAIEEAIDTEGFQLWRMVKKAQDRA